MRYGDLLSPLLSILSPEVMACNNRQNDQLQSIKIKNEEVKFSPFADDMTCFLSPLTDIRVPVRMFFKILPLKIERRKNRVRSLTNLSYQFKFWGCILTRMSCLRKKANFEAILKPIEGNGEGSNLLKEFMSTASPIHVSTDLIQVAKKFFYFIWNERI